VLLRRVDATLALDQLNCKNIIMGHLLAMNTYEYIVIGKTRIYMNCNEVKVKKILSERLQIRELLLNKHLQNFSTGSF
jgi:hypothetical protein